MNDELESSLRHALKSVDPPDDFAERVLARVREENAPSSRQPRWRQNRYRSFAAALAASAVIAVVLVHSWQERQERRGLEARQQLIEALRVTGEKLDMAYQGVNAGSRRSAPEDAGA
jgi:hypothetical protein